MKKSTILKSLCLTILSLLPICAQAGVSVGDSVTPFAANTDSGDLWRLDENLSDGYLVVYFYPAAMTGGCTKQACAYRDQSAALNEANAQVVGVSGDSVNALGLFKDAHSLNFTLLSDANGSIAEIFGVATRAGGEITRTVDGVDHILERGITTMRWTFILDSEGKVIYKNDKVSAVDDVSEVLTKLGS